MDPQSPSRRSFFLQGSAFPLSLAAAPLVRAADAPASAEPDGIARDAASIHQEPRFQAPRDRIYRILTSSELFDQVVKRSSAASVVLKPGAPATRIDAVPGGEFVLFGGYVTGRTIELVPGKRLVQAWRPMSWPEGIFSIVRFSLEDAGGATRLVLDHTGFPTDQAEHLAQGWHINYWNPIAEVAGGKA
jgi:activator of HSP90 ATPase